MLGDPSMSNVAFPIVRDVMLYISGVLFSSHRECATGDNEDVLHDVLL